MGPVVAVVALVFVLFLVLGAYATVRAVHATKRRVDRTVIQARRTMEDTALKAKTFAQPGPAGELAQLRLRLRTTMRATQDALRASAGEDDSLKESLGLFQRLSVHGRELDGELRRLESEPDRATLARRLPALRQRTERIVESADSLRWAARDRAHRFANDDLDSLSAQIDMEAGALRHWTTAPEATAPETTAAQRSTGSWREPQPPSAESAEQTWPDQSAAPGTDEAYQEPDRPAITPPGRRAAFSWQKKNRPETTT